MSDEFYEVIRLEYETYIEYFGWQDDLGLRAIKVNQEQARRIEDFESQQAEDRNQFLKLIVEQAKGDI